MRSVPVLVLVSPMLAALAASVVAAADPDTTDSGVLANASPVWLADVQGPANLDPAEQYVFNPDGDRVYNAVDPLGSEYSGDFPSPEEDLDPDHPEVQAIVAGLDWTKVPDAPQRSLQGPGELDLTGYDQEDDPDCWWSSTVCKDPKQTYLPPDISYCPRPGDWGLNYDDGPFQEALSAPALYDLLASRENQKATLFYIGSNVVQYPEAAQRALSDGHTICSHTWSHPLMTTLTNEGIVAELYWTQKAIKTVLGITPKCWRPPFGDVDDRVRAIAWQMGMRTFLWDQDSNDWSLGSSSSETIGRSSLDDSFKDWILQSNDGTHGHITLQHESTFRVSERWLPKLQKHFRVMTIHQCINDPHPYWEDNWVYPILDQPNPSDSDVDPTTTDAVRDPRVRAASVGVDTRLGGHDPGSIQPGKSASSSLAASVPFALFLRILMFNMATSAIFYWRL